ncbi:hypothetical protein GCM10029976_091820 [Kribbella albertanoniae]
MLIGLVAVLVGSLLQVASASASGRVTYVVSAPFYAGADKTGSGWASCPAGSKVTGGGVDSSTHSIDAMTSGYPTNDGTGWAASIIHGQAGASFTVSAVCVSGLSGYTIVSSPNQVAPGATSGTYAACANDQQLVGGGAGHDSAKLTLRHTTYYKTSTEFAAAKPPPPSYDAWVARYFNSDTVAHIATTFAICARGIAGLSYPASAVSDIRTNVDWAEAECPAGTEPLGGGAFGPIILGMGNNGTTWDVAVSLDLVHLPQETKYQAVGVCGR